jgi:hypothetical protein
VQAEPVDPQRKAALVTYYEQIAQTLEEAAQELREGRVPHGKCGALRGHADHLPREAGDVIGPELLPPIATPPEPTAWAPVPCATAPLLATLA